MMTNLYDKAGKAFVPELFIPMNTFLTLSVDWILKPPSIQKCVLPNIHFNVRASHCRMMYVQSLTLEGCFHIHLLKGGHFSVSLHI